VHTRIQPHHRRVWAGTQAEQDCVALGVPGRSQADLYVRSNSRSNIIRYSINFKNQKKLLSRTVTSRPKSIDIQVDIFQTTINTQKDKVSLDFTA